MPDDWNSPGKGALTICTSQVNHSLIWGLRYIVTEWMARVRGKSDGNIFIATGVQAATQCPLHISGVINSEHLVHSFTGLWIHVKSLKVSSLCQTSFHRLLDPPNSPACSSLTFPVLEIFILIFPPPILRAANQDSSPFRSSPHQKIPTSHALAEPYFSLWHLTPSRPRFPNWSGWKNLSTN